MAATSALKKRAPRVHAFAKRIFYWSKLPALKRLNGKLTLAWPRLFGIPPDEPHVLGWIGELLRPGNTFLDVGAHCGWMSLAACHAVGKRGRVIALEASPGLADVLRYNKAVNRFQQMEIVSKAVADCDGGVVRFHLVSGGSSRLNSLLDHPLETEGTALEKSAIEVETITLDKFCLDRDLQPDVVKIDVEGAELLVLSGSERLLKECRTTFIVAVHPAWLPAGQTPTDIFELFQSHGFRVAAKHVVRSDGHGDYVFAPKAASAV
jgi:FkbM family methyltransferase